MECLTKLVDYADGEETEEPVGNFIYRYSGDFVKYFQNQGLQIGILGALKTANLSH